MLYTVTEKSFPRCYHITVLYLRNNTILVAWFVCGPYQVGEVSRLQRTTNKQTDELFYVEAEQQQGRLSHMYTF